MYDKKMTKKYFWSSAFDLAFSNYADEFELNPEAWWLAMEALRCMRFLVQIEEKREKAVVCFPLYVNNSYQLNQYSVHKQFNYTIYPIAHRLVIDDALANATFAKRLVFHQHWLKDIYWQVPSLAIGMTVIQRHLGIIRALKAYDAIVCWSLHNLMEHDATPLQEKLHKYAIKKMADLSDYIFIHTQGAGESLSLYCETDLTDKFRLLEHPLYDDLLQLSTSQLPEEIDNHQMRDRRVLLSVGMINPYKGMPDLIRAFQKVVQRNNEHNMHLIIAGQLNDPAVSVSLNSLDESTRNCMSFIGRRVEENELAGLMRLADVFVTSYKKILTSGSYYLATTFAKPTVAPRIGMFPAVIQEDETGFLYDGSVDDLALLLGRISRLPEQELVRIGSNALKTCEHLKIADVSNRFFSFLDSVV